MPSHDRPHSIALLSVAITWHDNKRVSKARYALVDTTSSSVKPNVISDELRKFIKLILTRLNSNVQTRRAHNFIDMAGFSPDAGSSISRPSHQHFRCRTV